MKNIFLSFHCFGFVCGALAQKKMSGKPIIKEEKTYAALQPSPVIIFCGMAKGTILTDSVRNAKALFVSAPYAIKSATVYFGAGDVQMGAINSNDLTPIIPLLMRCGNGTPITFDDVLITDGKKNYYAESMSFIVKDNW